MILGATRIASAAAATSSNPNGKLNVTAARVVELRKRRLDIEAIPKIAPDLSS
jgi:hypothetical protein